MTEADLDAGLRSLRASLRQIEALWAWDQLQRAESEAVQPPAFRIADSIESDLQNEYSFFVATSVQIRSLLNDGSSAIPQEQRERLGRQLAKIEQRLCRLDLHRRRCLC